MNWQEVCEHPSLKDLLFKIELNEYGQIIMSPLKVYHSAFQGEIEHLLRSLVLDGKTLPECAIATEQGTKVADVAWISPERFKQVRDETECSITPEICIEVISASNSANEIQQKMDLYFKRGAREFWFCGNRSLPLPAGGGWDIRANISPHSQILLSPWAWQ